MGGADVVTLHVQFWFVDRRRHRCRCWTAPSAGHLPGSCGLLFCSSWSCRASASVCWPLRATSSWTSSSRSQHFCSPCGSATRRAGGSPRPQCCSRVAPTPSARESCSRRACSPRRSSSPGRDAGRGSLAASLAVGLAVLPWRIWTARHDISSGTPPSFDTGRLARRASPLVRRPLLERTLVGPAPRGDDRTRRRRGLG